MDDKKLSRHKNRNKRRKKLVQLKSKKTHAAELGLKIWSVESTEAECKSKTQLEGFAFVWSHKHMEVSKEPEL